MLPILRFERSNVKEQTVKRLGNKRLQKKGVFGISLAL
jgi:hypothetical protein